MTAFQNYFIKTILHSNNILLLNKMIILLLKRFLIQLRHSTLYN